MFYNAQSLDKPIHFWKETMKHWDIHAYGAKIKELERENWELKKANEILKKAAAFFAQA